MIFYFSPILLLISFLSGIGISFKYFNHGSSSFAPSILTEKIQYYLTDNQKYLDIIFYDIDIELFHDKKFIQGDVTLKAASDKNIFPVDLNLYDNMKINSITWNGRNTNFRLNRSTLSILDTLKISDTVDIRINYEGTPKNLGLSSFVFGKINNRSLIYTLNEPNYASTWLPCNDRPDDKAFMEIKIKSDSSKISLSNGKLIDVKTDKDKKIFHWKTFYPISTYLICLYSSDYVELKDFYVSADNDTMNISYYVLPGQEEKAWNDMKRHPEILKVFSNLFGLYPFIKEKYAVAVFLWQMGAMEHQTITGIGSNFIVGNNYFEDVYVHEAAHHWWGNAVGPATWKDIWLNEGFSTYSEALFYEVVNGKEALKENMSRKFSEGFYGALYDPKELFSSTVYEKGAWVLHMLRKEVGDELFFSGLKKYFETFKYSNASTHQFISLMESHSGKNLHRFFEQWVYEGSAVPKIFYSWTTEKSGNDFILKLKLRQQSPDDIIYSLPMDILIEYENSESTFHSITLDEKKSEFQIVLKDMPTAINFDPDSWLLAGIYEDK